MDAQKYIDSIFDAVQPINNELIESSPDPEQAIDFMINECMPNMFRMISCEQRLKVLAMLSSIMNMQTGELLDGIH